MSDKIFAGERQYLRTLILGLCAGISDITESDVLQCAKLEFSVLYQVQANNKIGSVSSTVLKQNPR